MGSVVKAKVRYMEENPREVRILRISKDVVGCVQAVLGEEKFPVIFEYVNKREMSYI